MEGFPHLIYILKEEVNGKEFYGAYEMYIGDAYYRHKNFNVRGFLPAASSLEDLAQNLAANREYIRNTGLSFTKRDFFPDTFIDAFAVHTYSELTPEEITRFNEYLKRIMEGKPLKKRHNPEITAEDLAKIEVKE